MNNGPIASTSSAQGAASLSLIAAVARNRVIGRGNRLPWRLPEDLRRFRQLTWGHAVIMGRKTFQSLGRALPGRRNFVLSRSAGFSAPGAEVRTSLDEALARLWSGERAFVIGGAEIYALALPWAERLYLTEIDADYDGDTFFPDFDRSAWREARRESGGTQGELRFDFVEYERR